MREQPHEHGKSQEANLVGDPKVLGHLDVTSKGERRALGSKPAQMDVVVLVPNLVGNIPHPVGGLDLAKYSGALGLPRFGAVMSFEQPSPLAGIKLIIEASEYVLDCPIINN